MLGTKPSEINSAYTDPCAPKPTMPTLVSVIDRPVDLGLYGSDESAATEPVSEHHGLQSAQFSQLDIRTTGVPAITSPFGFTVPDQDEAPSGPLHRTPSPVQVQPAISAYDERADLGFGGSDDHGAVRWQQRDHAS
jgi:hypothetical protein